ncbi:MAG: hypothetical protein PHO27_05585 [Sulfuricurvum sp.]|nr:hypothetical protein [Sulfuricurvum sp.]
MTYTDWFQIHTKKHRAIVNRLSAEKLTPEQIVEYFEFDNMVYYESDFCLLYTTKTKCHDIPHLNCYWCACPHFRFDDNALPNIEKITVYSHCAINAPLGKVFHHESSLHHDCSDCTIPHESKVILKNFSIDWKDTMKKCLITSNI